MANFGHNKKHAIDSSTDHTSTITENNLISADANGLPKDSGNTSAEVTSNTTHRTGDGSDHAMVTFNNYTATTAPGKSNDNTEGYTVGSVWFDTVHKQIYRCINPTTDEADWSIEIGVGSFVVNKTGSTIPKGSVVYQVSAQGGTPTIALAKADAEATSAGTWGVVISGVGEENISNNGFGYIMSRGRVYNLNTSSFSDGDLLFLSESIDGGVRNTKPTSPDHSVFVGHIDLSHSSEGIVFVHIDNGFELNELHDVNSTSADTDMQTITFDTSTGIYSPDLVIPEMTMSGVTSWAGTGDYYDSTFAGGVFTLLRAPTGRINGKEITASVPQSTGVLSANTTSFVYIDSSGAIQTTTTRSHALFLNNIVLFEVLYDGTNYEVVKEDHPYNFPTPIANDLHDTAGTVFEPNTATLERVTSGTGSVATDRQLKQTGDAEIHDQGIEAVLSDSSGVGVTIRHYYTNASGKWLRNVLSATFPMLYNNAGTPTTIPESDYGVFGLYLSKDDKNSSAAKLFSIMHTSEYTNITQAQTAIANNGIVAVSNELETLEMAFYGYIIVRNNASGGYIAEVDIEKSVLGGSVLGGGASNNASLIVTNTTNFDGLLSSADTNVQAALETLDDSAASVAEIDAGSVTNKVITPGNLATSDFGTKELILALYDSDTSWVVGDGKVGLPIGLTYDGWTIVGATAVTETKGIQSASETMDIQLRRKRAGAVVDVLTTKIQIGDAYYASSTDINLSNDDLQIGDIIFPDVDSIHLGTAAVGGYILVRIQKI